jgi:hypothetical protein
MLFPESAIVAAIVLSAASSGDQNTHWRISTAATSRLSQSGESSGCFSSMVIGTKEEPNIVGGCHLDRNIDDLIQHAVFGSKPSTPGPKSFELCPTSYSRAGQVSELITSVHGVLCQLGRPNQHEEVSTPAVPVRQSVRHDYVVCLDCGYRGKCCYATSVSSMA